MNLGIENKRALVTGASAGLGLATAVALSKEGVKLAINSRSMENLARASSEIKLAGGYEPAIVVGSMGETGEAEKIARETNTILGGIDILVVNAGGPPAGMFADINKDTWRSAAELTLHSAIDLTRAVLDGMAAQKWGRIIYITSIAVRQPVNNLIISNTLRAGLTGFAKSLSNQYGKFGITVNTICPGYHATERLKGLADFQSKKQGISTDEVYRQWAESSAVKRIGNPAEFGSVAAFLASNQASFITGAAIPVDGGSYKGLL